MDTFRIGLIGAGSIGARHIKAIDEVAHIELVAIADPSPAASSLAAARGIPVFVDADMMLLRESGKPQGREPLELVLSRLPPESNEELKSGMELDDDYGA